MAQPENKVFICGSVRDCATYIPAVFENIRRIIPLFNDFHIIMSLDVSSDNSFELIQAHRRYFKDKMCVLYNTAPLPGIRVERISNSRNRILNRIRDVLKFKQDFNLFIMIDCDDVCATKIKPEILSKYLSRTDWSGLSFNRRDYYDIWALSFSPYMYSCWHFIDAKQVINEMRTQIQKHLSKLGVDELFQCSSAFNGFSIYRISDFINCEYDWRIDYSYFTLEIFKLNAIHAKSSPVKREPNQDCEHRMFHFQAIRKNNARIMISPLYLFE